MHEKVKLTEDINKSFLIIKWSVFFVVKQLLSYSVKTLASLNDYFKTLFDQ